MDLIHPGAWTPEDPKGQIMGGMIEQITAPEAVQARKDAYHRAAIHESGHCVAAWLNGCIIEYATLNGDGGMPLRMQRHGPFKKARSLDAADVSVILAGAAAEQIHDLDPWEGAEFDLESLAGVIAPPDPETAAMREFLAHHPDTDAREFAEMFLPSIVDQLSDPRALKCIEAGAAMIEAGGTVPGRLLVQLFEHCWGDPLPPGAFGHKWHPAGDDEPAEPDPAQALDAVEKALAGLMDAVENLRVAHGFENPDVEALAGKYLESHFWLADKLEFIKVKGILENGNETQRNPDLVGTE
jgi:hypothetical protein